MTATFEWTVAFIFIFHQIEGGVHMLSIHRHPVLILCFFDLFFFAKSIMLVVMLSFNVGAYIFMEKA